jgi:hypothetical protein
VTHRRQNTHAYAAHATHTTQHRRPYTHRKHQKQTSALRQKPGGPRIHQETTDTRPSTLDTPKTGEHKRQRRVATHALASSLSARAVDTSDMQNSFTHTNGPRHVVAVDGITTRTQAIIQQRHRTSYVPCRTAPVVPTGAEACGPTSAPYGGV